MRCAYRRLFIRFLKEEKLYYTFRQNHAKLPLYPIHGVKYTISQYLKKVEKECAISDAFLWNNTLEGQDFWAIVSNRWRKCLEKNGYIRISFSRYWRI